MQLGSYRPISLLSCLSKIYEKIIHKRLINYLEENNIIINEQFGFQKNKSTTAQLARIVNNITINYNINRITSVCTLDLEKAFDTVWIEGLVYKLDVNKVPDHLTKTIESFLNNRTFQVKINNSMSPKTNIPNGTPQGAILSPTLFAIYINDIPSHTNTKLALFADDTAIIAESKNVILSTKYLQRHLNTLYDYFTKWKVQINPEKTSLIHFTKKRIKQNLPELHWNGTPINISKCIKYLGVHLDVGLSYKQHITETVKKANRALFALYSMLNRFSPIEKELKLYIYKAYLRPILLYSCPIFSNCSKTQMNRLQIYQNKILRIIYNTNSRTKTALLHDLANIPTIQDKIHEMTNKFYSYQIKKCTFTSSIGTLNKDTVPFKIKHKLLN